MSSVRPELIVGCEKSPSALRAGTWSDAASTSAAQPVQVTYYIVQMECGKLLNFAPKTQNVRLETGPEVKLERDGMTLDELCAGRSADHQLSRILLNPKIMDTGDMDNPSEEFQQK
ncbi:hypothetical protein G0P98_19975 [Yangia sp. PrR004]|nr:hypothetical protein [Salipiger sp. PrR004]